MDNGDEVYGDEPTEVDCGCDECAEVGWTLRATGCTCFKCDGNHTCPDCLRDTL